MLKIDVDRVSRRSRLYLQTMFYGVPPPFYYRFSSSGDGLHLMIPQCRSDDYRRAVYDDPMRIALDEQRRVARLPVHNLLWDVKNGKPAADWIPIADSAQVERELDHIKGTPSSSNYLWVKRTITIMARKQRDGKNPDTRGRPKHLLPVAPPGTARCKCGAYIAKGGPFLTHARQCPAMIHHAEQHGGEPGDYVTPYGWKQERSL